MQKEVVVLKLQNILTFEGIQLLLLQIIRGMKLTESLDI